VTLEDALRDRKTLVRLFQLAFWSSIVLMAIGFYIIIRDLLG
jgi:hypothetical protein